jgi:hypothetical protein
MQTLLIKTGLILMLLWLPSCAAKKAVVIDSQRDVVVLADDVKGHVFVKNDKGVMEKTANKVTLPAGWHAAAYTPPPVPTLPQKVTQAKVSLWWVVVLAGLLILSVKRKKKG